MGATEIAIARDIMTTDVKTFTSMTTIEDAIGTLLENRISGAPVVDEDGALLGIISEFQLLAVVYDESLLHNPIGEFMTIDVITVNDETSLSEVANRLIIHRIRRLPVVRAGHLVGLISRCDILRYAVGQGSMGTDTDFRDMILHLEPQSPKIAAIAL